MLPYYKSLIHDITSPVISLFSVWLGARFGLKNEFYTKELDARLFRLETLSGRCMTALLNISDYLGFLPAWSTMVLLYTGRGSLILTTSRETYCLWYEEAEQSP